MTVENLKFENMTYRRIFSAMEASNLVALLLGGSSSESKKMMHGESASGCDMKPSSYASSSSSLVLIWPVFGDTPAERIICRQRKQAGKYKCIHRGGIQKYSGVGDGSGFLTLAII